MSDLLKRIERDALSLSQQERAFLADRLLSSLDGSALSDIDIAWIAEAERRYKEYQDGKRQGLLAHEVFEEADKILR